VAAHRVWLDDNDIATLARRGVGVAHCPSSNMKLASGIAPVLKLLRLDVGSRPRAGTGLGRRTTI
jgi:5-methylthioadenosine/S-adenosylhomocysteine deaminase